MKYRNNRHTERNSYLTPRISTWRNCRPTCAMKSRPEPTPLPMPRGDAASLRARSSMRSSQLQWGFVGLGCAARLEAVCRHETVQRLAYRGHPCPPEPAAAAAASARGGAAEERAPTRWRRGYASSPGSSAQACRWATGRPCVRHSRFAWHA